jgi:hypothetical protein
MNEFLMSYWKKINMLSCLSNCKKKKNSIRIELQMKVKLKEVNLEYIKWRLSWKKLI